MMKSKGKMPELMPHKATKTMMTPKQMIRQMEEKRVPKGRKK